jgi:hypothetical protein
VTDSERHPTTSTLETLDRLRAQIEHAEANEHEWLTALARRKLREAASAPLLKNTKARLW